MSKKIEWHKVLFAQHDKQSNLTLLWHGDAFVHGVMGDGKVVTSWQVETPYPPVLIDVIESVEKHIELQYFPKG